MFSLAMVSPSLLLSQESSHLAPASAEVAQQFAAIHHSLDQTAESMLVSTATRVANQESPESQKYPVSEPSNTPGTDPSSRRPSGALGVQDLIKSILVREGVPEDLAAVVFIESGGNPLALSPKGARGLWQFMPDTARQYGLTVDSRRDDRLDLEKSTASAARYLRDLYSRFGSWPLALAAYDTGEQNVLRAIMRGRSREFETLSMLQLLPAETRHYVPAVFAAMRSTPGRALSTSQRYPGQGTGLVFAFAGQ
jgi:soluble lytic murein transglycosylase-like protein